MTVVSFVTFIGIVLWTFILRRQDDFSAQAALFMAHKWSHPERVEQLLREFRANGAEYLLRAVTAYESRARDGSLPTPIDAEHKIGTFVGDVFSEHRFAL